MSASWFYGAPVTKLVVFSTAATTALCLKVAAAPDLFLRAASLDTSRVLASGELWRLVTCHIPFATVAQLLFGLPFLYEMRKLERMGHGESRHSIQGDLIRVNHKIAHALHMKPIANIRPGVYGWRRWWCWRRCGDSAYDHSRAVDQ